jgi:hypothetical protein
MDGLRGAVAEIIRRLDRIPRARIHEDPPHHHRFLCAEAIPQRDRALEGGRRFKNSMLERKTAEGSMHAETVTLARRKCGTRLTKWTYE